jgi:predicted transcriptional regulator
VTAAILAAPMPEPTPLHGELQAQVMAALWRLGGSGTVEQVRAELPPKHRGAYTTVQTVLTRLAERGVLSRERQGRGYVYATRVSEDDYLAHAISRTLASASDDARHSALARLIGELDAAELSKVQRLARKARRRRQA